MKNIGFLFDLDGVLIDSEEQYSQIWVKILQEFPTGIPEFEKKIKGMTLSKILTEFFPDEKMQEEVCLRIHLLESQMIYNYTKGAKELLYKLKENEIPTALVTSSDKKKMKHLNEEIPNFTDFFDYIVTAEQVKISKPNPEGYLLAAENLNVDSTRCVVFEDSLQGVMAGKNAGAYVVGVAGTLPASVIQPYSDIIVNSLTEINFNSLVEELLNR